MNRRSFIERVLQGSTAPAALVLGAAITSCSAPSIPGFSGRGGRNEGAGLGSGSNWIGRRYFTRQTRFWGYVKRPGDSWDKSVLVIFNEKFKHAPDRLPELVTEGTGHGYDHNYEYRLNGTFSGNVVYDPNSNKFLPEFVLREYELISKTPGHLFSPSESYSPFRLPPR